MNEDTKLTGRPQISIRDDASLLTDVQAGEQRAMAALYDRYARLVYSVALRVLRDQGAAEDIVQEVFMQLWRNPDSFTAARANLGSWLAFLARSLAIDTLRRRRATTLIADLPLVAPGNLSDEVERNTLIARARTSIQQLPREQRKSLEMAFFDGLTHSEIAEMTGDPLGTVKTRIRTALLSLRKAYQG